MAAAVSLDAQSSCPFTKRQTGETGHYYKIQNGHDNSKQDCRSLSRISSGARATTKHSRDQSSENNQGNECDVVDQQSAATERERGFESLTAMSGDASSCLGARQTLGNGHLGTLNCVSCQWSVVSCTTTGLLTTGYWLTNQKMQRGLAHSQFITTVEYTWLPGGEAYRVVDHGTVYGS